MITGTSPIRSQPAHRSQPMFELAVIGLDRIVGVPFDVMPRRRDQFLEHGRVDGGRVGDDLARRHLQRGERSSEESPGGIGVAVSRDEHVDDLPVGVDSPVHVPPPAADLDIRLIHQGKSTD